MNPWKLLASAPTPDDGETLRLYQRDSEFSITVGPYELMNSRIYGADDVLAQVACAKIAGRPRARILIGGLGMGFTVRTALNELGDQAQVVVAELVPAVVQWNRTYLGELAGNPLDDERVTICEVDVGPLIDSAQSEYDAILLDVDNGPEALTQKGNAWLYSPQGLAAAHAALRPKGVLAIWSADAAPRFARQLQQAGFEAEEVKARAKGRSTKRGGTRFIVWTGVRS